MFGRGIKLFRLLEFEVKVDLSWIALAILVAWSLSTGLFPVAVEDLPPRSYWTMGITGAIGLFLSIIAHEFSHSLVARKRGMPMKGITLFIFGGVAEMGEEPPEPKTELMIAVAGPLSSMVIALFFYGLYLLGHGRLMSDPVNAVIGYLAMINGLLAAFNLVPAYPLDGGRILRAMLWGLKKDINWATRIASGIGSAFGFLLIFMGLLNLLGGNLVGGMWWILIGMFLNSAARMSYQRLVTRRALEGEKVRRFMSRDPVTVSPSLTMEDFVEKIVYRHHHKLYPVVEKNGRLAGCISTSDAKSVSRDEWPNTTVDEFIDPCSLENTIQPDEDAVNAFSIMRRSGRSRLLVVEEGQLVGILSLKDLLGFLSLKVELEK